MSCHEICCGEGGDQILSTLWSKEPKLSYDKIGQLCGSSRCHIRDRVEQLKLPHRKRTDYISMGGSKKRSPLWQLSDKELFETPVSVLMERYGLSRFGVCNHKSRLRKEMTFNEKKD